jgi:predicted transcriptional regulator
MTDERITIYLEPDLKRRLEQIAAHEDRSLSSLIRQAVRRIVERGHAIPAPETAERIKNAASNRR